MYKIHAFYIDTAELLSMMRFIISKGKDETTIIRAYAGIENKILSIFRIECIERGSTKFTTNWYEWHFWERNSTIYFGYFEPEKINQLHLLKIYWHTLGDIISRFTSFLYQKVNCRCSPDVWLNWKNIDYFSLLFLHNLLHATHNLHG